VAPVILAFALTARSVLLHSQRWHQLTTAVPPEASPPALSATTPLPAETRLKVSQPSLRSEPCAYSGCEIFPSIIPDLLDVVNYGIKLKILINIYHKNASWVRWWR